MAAITGIVYTGAVTISPLEWLLIICDGFTWLAFVGAYIRDDSRRGRDALEVRLMGRMDESDQFIAEELSDRDAPAQPIAAVTPLRGRRVLTPVD